MVEYVISIVVCILAADIAVMLLPDGNYKKYLKLISSIIIMGVVLSPLINFDFSGIRLDFEEYFELEADKHIQNNDYIYEDHVREIYERNSVLSE